MFPLSVQDRAFSFENKLLSDLDTTIPLSQTYEHLDKPTLTHHQVEKEHENVCYQAPVLEKANTYLPFANEK